MADNEHVFPQEQFQPILEQSMALDGLLETADITISFKDIKKAISKSLHVMGISTPS